MSGNIQSQRMDYQDDQFFKFLDANQDKPVKVISVIGSSGVGKSFFLNYLLQDIEQQKHLKNIFPSSQSSQIEFCGVKYYLNKEKFLLFLEFEGIDYSKNNEQMNSLKNCLKDCADASTCIFYVHQNSRTNKGFEQILTLINTQNQRNAHLFEILNLWNGDTIQSYSQSQEYKAIFSDVFYLKALNFKKKSIQKDSNLIQFLDKMQDINRSIDSLNLNKMYCGQLNQQIFQKFRDNNVKFLNMEKNAVSNQLQTYSEKDEIKIQIIQKIILIIPFSYFSIFSIIKIIVNNRQ
ncbi:hypothetical protein ABPG72_002951 [Tetrahymena utriculariae]